MNHRENAGILWALCHIPVRPATWERIGSIAGQGRPQVKNMKNKLSGKKNKTTKKN
jgi:hypothetical protein